MVFMNENKQECKCLMCNQKTDRKNLYSSISSKVIFVTFNLICELHAVSVGKPSAPLIRSRLWRFINLFTYLQMSIFWTVPIRLRFLYLNPNRISVFRTPPIYSHFHNTQIPQNQFITYKLE